MTTKRELRVDKVTVLAGLASNPAFTAMDYDQRFATYCEIMTLVVDVHEDHPDEEPDKPTEPRSSFDWDVAINMVLDSGDEFRRDYPSKNTAQTTTSKLKKKYTDFPVRFMTKQSETGGGCIIVTKRVVRAN